MGADCPQHLRHETFCKSLVQDTVASIMKSDGNMDLDTEQTLQKKSCTCFDGFYDKSSKLYGQADMCMTDKDWKCNFGTPDEILEKYPECQDWITYGEDFQKAMMDAMGER